jgi:transposase
MARKVIAMEAKLLAVFSSGVPVSVTELARDLGVSRQTVYKYRLRWAGEGAAGLVERSRRPRNVASVFCAEMEQLVVRLREELPVDNGARRSGITWNAPSWPPAGRDCRRCRRFTGSWPLEDW